MLLPVNMKSVVLFFRRLQSGTTLPFKNEKKFQTVSISNLEILGMFLLWLGVCLCVCVCAHVMEYMVWFRE